MAMKLILIVLLTLLSLFGMFHLFNFLLTPPSNNLVSSQDFSKFKPSREQGIPVLTNEQARLQATQAKTYINQLRESVGLNHLATNSALNQSAKNHANYSIINDIQGHFQQEGMPNFSGKSPTERAFIAGHQARVSEVISYNRAEASLFVDDLMSAIYHRISLLDMTIDQIGIGISTDNKGSVKSAFVANLANQQLAKLCSKQLTATAGERYYKNICQDKQAIIPANAFLNAQEAISKHNPPVIFWPAENSTVPPVFSEETPDPLPDCNVSGYPAHIQINPFYKSKINLVENSFKMYEIKDGQPIKVPLVASMTDLTDHNHQVKAEKPSWYAIFPKQRLNWGSEYQAVVQYLEFGKFKTLKWNFNTPTIPNLTVFLSSTANKSPLPIKVGESKALYFKPAGCVAPKKSNMQTTVAEHIKLEKNFIDGQTIQLNLKSANVGDIITIKYLPTNTLVKLKVIK